jgi:hypothetical protein
MLKIPRPKVDDKEIDPARFKDLKAQWERADQYLSLMPPASLDGAWYGVVRVHFRENAEVVVKSRVKVGLICKEQLIDADDEASVTCWEYNGVEFRAGDDIDGMIAFRERRMAEAARANPNSF